LKWDGKPYQWAEGVSQSQNREKVFVCKGAPVIQQRPQRGNAPKAPIRRLLNALRCINFTCRQLPTSKLTYTATPINYHWLHVNLHFGSLRDPLTLGFVRRPVRPNAGRTTKEYLQAAGALLEPRTVAEGIAQLARTSRYSPQCLETSAACAAPCFDSHTTISGAPFILEVIEALIMKMLEYCKRPLVGLDLKRLRQQPWSRGAESIMEQHRFLSPKAPR
jgi:hypothetical protein